MGCIGCALGRLSLGVSRFCGSLGCIGCALGRLSLAVGRIRRILGCDRLVVGSLHGFAAGRRGAAVAVYSVGKAFHLSRVPFIPLQIHALGRPGAVAVLHKQLRAFPAMFRSGAGVTVCAVLPWSSLQVHGSGDDRPVLFLPFQAGPFHDGGRQLLFHNFRDGRTMGGGVVHMRGQQLRPFHNGLLRLLQGGDAFIDLADDFFRGGRRGLCFGGLAHIYSCAAVAAS